MGAVIFNTALFRTKFPAYSNATLYPDATLQMNFDTAALYINNQSGGCYCGGMNIPQQTQALYLMTAHLTALGVLIAGGETPGLVDAATIDKVSVTLEPPPVKTQWQWWLSLTPYGQQLLALLQIASVGGWYAGGRPEIPAFRRARGWW